MVRRPRVGMTDGFSRIRNGRQIGVFTARIADLDDAVDGGAQAVPIARAVHHHDRFGVQAKLLPSDNFKHLLQGAQAARQNDETIRQFGHARFAFVHRGNDL